MDFTKYHGLGNDFVFVEDFAGTQVAHGAEWAKVVCDRHFGIGADGLVFITRPEGQYTMRIFNADGSEAEMCGNAIRCVARHVIDKGLVASNKLTVGTLEGPKEVRLVDGEYTVNMGRPQWDPARIPTTATPDSSQTISVSVDSVMFSVVPVSMGNPHAIVVVDDLDDIPFARWGPALEKHSVLPAKSNIEFVQVMDRGHIRVKVWERGVGPTLACGTGACASVAAAASLGLTDRRVEVELPGGILTIVWDEQDSLWMTGPATRVFSGRWESDLI